MSNSILQPPCIFCAYNDEDYWEAASHAKTCPWFAVGSESEREGRLRDVVSQRKTLMTEAQQRLVKLDLRKPEIEAYYQELEQTVAQVAAEIGLNGYFEAPDGTVYKIVKPSGRFVLFKDLDFLRTKREGEERGTLSKVEADKARANGFKPLL